MERDFFEVSKLSWERVFLHIEIYGNYSDKVFFQLENIDIYHGFKAEKDAVEKIQAKEIVQLPYEEYKNGKYIFICNITTLNGRSFLNNGCWRMVAVVDEKKYICHVSHDVAYNFDEYSRIFRYGRDIYAYNISFSSLTEEETYLWFIINSYFMKKNDGWFKRHYMQEAQNFSEKLKRLYKSTSVILIKMVYQFWEHIFPKYGKNILLMSENKDYLCGNLKALDDKLKEKGLNRRFKISYSLRTSVGKRKSIFSWIKLIF